MRRNSSDVDQESKAYGYGLHQDSLSGSGVFVCAAGDYLVLRMLASASGTTAARDAAEMTVTRVRLT